MKIVVSENETVIYPMLGENDTPNDEDFVIVLGNTCTMINSAVVDEDDLPKIIDGLEKALEIL